MKAYPRNENPRNQRNFNGVNTWPKHFPTCGGTSQSPININNPTYRYLGNIWFTNYGAIPSNVQTTATNNGHSYSVTFTGYTDSSNPKIANGGLPGVFKLEGLYFHWGSDDSQGSEHRVNNMAFPAELHLVHLNTKYSSVPEGLKHGDGLAVLNVLLRRGRHNYNYNFLNRAAQQVPYPGNKANIAVSSIADLLPNDKSFYRYQGSLTTPECQQVVTWTVFANTVEISEAQLNALRGCLRNDVGFARKQLLKAQSGSVLEKRILEDRGQGAIIKCSLIRLIGSAAEYGVNTWPEHFPTCGGTNQSPINISNPTYSSLGNIWFTNYGAIPSSVQTTATNNGHSYSVTFSGYTDSSNPKIANGGLPGVFKLVEFHFHWGSDDSQGSEHRVNNRAFPAELHLVHLNTKYSNFTEGVKHADGLAVLSVLLRRGRHNNNNYNFLNSAAQQVPYPDNTATIAVSSLAGLLPYHKSFYRYQGSLTTPECEQVVTWTVFANTVKISEAQLNALRDVCSLIRWQSSNNANVDHLCSLIRFTIFLESYKPEYVTLVEYEMIPELHLIRSQSTYLERKMLRKTSMNLCLSKYVFKLAEFHFHWGSNVCQGSEHRVNNMAFPAELHLVHTKYSSVHEGKKHPDGLAVLSVLLKEGHNNDNDNYNFLNLAAQVTKPGDTSDIAGFSLAGLLPNDKSFYRYQGSLTTPGCEEVVTWTVFAKTVEISEAQLNALRGMKYCDPVNPDRLKWLVDNYRPTQPLKGRSVQANFRSNGCGQHYGHDDYLMSIAHTMITLLVHHIIPPYTSPSLGHLYACLLRSPQCPHTFLANSHPYTSAASFDLLGPHLRVPYFSLLLPSQNFETSLYESNPKNEGKE
ncbi:Carbonic anhydrase 2, partial [Paramuricea clavata]